MHTHQIQIHVKQPNGQTDKHTLPPTRVPSPVAAGAPLPGSLTAGRLDEMQAIAHGMGAAKASPAGTPLYNTASAGQI